MLVAVERLVVIVVFAVLGPPTLLYLVCSKKTWHKALSLDRLLVSRVSPTETHPICSKSGTLYARLFVRVLQQRTPALTKVLSLVCRACLA